MAGLRRLISTSESAGVSPWRLSDEQVLQHLAWLLNRGILHVHRVPAPATASADRESVVPGVLPRAASFFKQAASQVSSARVPSAMDELDRFASQIDSEATAAALRLAAANGVPFCEECSGAAAAGQPA